MNTLRKLVSKITILGLVMTLMTPNISRAASLTSAQDQLSTNKASIAANHTIYFVTPTGIMGGQTMEITMTNFAVPAAMSFADMDLAEGSTGTCSTASYSEQTLAASASGTTWGAVSSDVTDTFMFTAGSSGITAGRCVRIKIGTNATGGTYQIVNGAVGSQNILIGGGSSTMADSTYIAVAMVTDPQVDLSAYVGSSLTMTLSSTSVSIGALSSSSTNETGSTIVTINSNSNSGYFLKYNASNLTNQSAYSLAALSSKTAAAPGTEQWGLNAASVNNAASGSDSLGSADSNYGTASSYMVVPSVDTLLASASGTAQSHAYTVTYGVDISALTPSGSYTGTVDYLVYGAF